MTHVDPAPADLDFLKLVTRTRLGENQHDPLTQEQVHIAEHLADWLALREGRDLLQAGDALLEASGCLGALAARIGVDARTATLVNVLGIAGLLLGERAT